jgi:tRNA 2-thiouridine synthesizing protein D
MKYTITITDSPFYSSASQTALKIANALLKKGHSFDAIFFQEDGVYHALAGYAPREEWNAHEAWKIFSLENNIELLLCSSASVRRGIFDAEFANEYQRTASTEKPFKLVSLLTFLEAAQKADRQLKFGNNAV